MATVCPSRAVPALLRRASLLLWILAACVDAVSTDGVDRLLRREVGDAAVGQEMLAGVSDGRRQNSSARQRTSAGAIDAKACYNARDLAYVSGEVKANRAFWSSRCHAFGRGDSADVSAILVQMGNVQDYYKPIPESNWCEMLQSNNKHLWSADGSTWQTPTYSGEGKYLGGSASGWPASKSESDSREFLSFWGGDGGLTGGCCADVSADTASAWGAPILVSACSRCSGLATIAGSSKADSLYWDTLCKGNAIPPTATMIRITMGSVIDYYKPVDGLSLCDMLQATDKHMWSPDGRNWIKPEYFNATNGEDYLGGSAANWPKQKVPGEVRSYLTFWGASDKTGGCCSNRLNDDCAGRAHGQCYNKAMRIDYCRDF
eukprot:TRINITY_DN35483_c0_g1_i1.p1 TRINITY_DN35483_c0_g1~~TRINITY_DN35483_c0_g1_i1.p1  ORF type:complete len:375 (+),score=61.53 TRINITY_DN35483_c0_g1_i1:95-1219(+)